MSIYDYTVKDIRGNDASLGQYKGKVLLIVVQPANVYAAV